MRLFFSRRIPDFERVLLVESGNRSLYDGFVPKITNHYGKRSKIDLVTCFAGLPKGLREDHDRVFRVSDYAGPAGRQRLYNELAATRYDVIGIICSEEPLMTKWKWMLAARTPAKLLIVNENGDYFWVDYSNWKLIAHFAFFRAGLTGGDAVSTIGRILLFPFSLLFLLLFAAWVHLRRQLRLLVANPSGR